MITYYAKRWPREDARSMDTHGAVEVIQKAMNLDIHSFNCSGTGPVTDQAVGTTYQIQRAIYLLSTDCFGKGESSCIIFVQPAIPYLPRPTPEMSPSQMSVLYYVEMLNASRALSSSNHNSQLKSFLSSKTGQAQTLGV